MSIHVLTITCLISLHISYVQSFNDFLRTYDVADVEIVDHRVKRSYLQPAYANSSDTESLEVRFTAFRKHFRLRLSKDSSFQKTPVESYFSGDLSENGNSLRANFYYGTLEGDSSNSSVFGYLLDGLFTGMVNVRNNLYFIEPASLHFDDIPSNSEKVIVYRDADIKPVQWNILPRNLENFPQWNIPFRSPDIFINVTEYNSGLNTTNQGDLFCEIELVADHSLYNFFKNDTDKLAAVLYLHSKFADYIFRRTDFDMDGSVDRIRIVIGKISIYKSVEDKNYPMVVAPTLTDYLTMFVTRKQNPRFCLSIGIMYRNYRGSAIGEAVKPHLRFTEAFGGICDPLVQSNKASSLSFNTGVINMQFQNGKPLPLAITMLALAHEIGHGFGSGHDPVDNPLCSPGKSENYLMYAFASYDSINAMKLSPCSRKDIWKILLLKGSCLVARNSTCGNGIREDPEECDCGSELACNLIDPCCTPSDAKPPERACTIRSMMGYSCSSKESECCEKNCLTVTDKQRICYSDTSLCLFSFCDGYTSHCPPPKKVLDFCRPTFVCNDAVCSNGTSCETLGLQSCICLGNISNECLQCCQSENDCVPASQLGILDPSGKPFILQPGTKCSDGKRTCDYSGMCVKNPRMISTSIELYVCFTIIPFIVSLLVIIAMFVSFEDIIENSGQISTDA